MFGILKHDVDDNPLDDISLEETEEAKKMIQNELRPVCTKHNVEIYAKLFLQFTFFVF